MENQHGVNIVALEFKSSGFGCGKGRGRRSVKSRDRNERVQRDAMLNVTCVGNEKENHGRGSGQDHQDYGGECRIILMGYRSRISRSV
ncbi:hypothetical protein CTI12_AA562240 [Artemisia annua]|uniref:Uncharacterized protein n=1 Tax=Artemisia annua TaxID=35608 RepID=A0A2U1KUQ6_ARTAN|nr:hypothetical protein CTI12_AA562240 [Artemisia annua]